MSFVLALSALVTVTEASEVRRVRIDDTQEEGVLRTIVQTESSDVGDPGSLVVSVTGLDSGEVLTFRGRAKSTESRSTAEITGSFGGAGTLVLTWSEDPTLVETVAFDGSGCEDGCDWQDAVLLDGSKVRVRPTLTVDADGTAVLSADIRWVPGDASTGTWAVTEASGEGEDVDGDGEPDAVAGFVSVPVYRTRWTTPKWSLADAAVRVDAVLTAPDGSTDALADLAVLQLEGSGLSEGTVQQRKKRPGYKASFITVSHADAPVASVDATVRDGEGNEVLAEIEALAPVETVTVLSAPLVLAGDDAFATLTVRDADGNTLIRESFALGSDIAGPFATDPRLALSQAAVDVSPDGERILRVALVGELAGTVGSAEVVVSTPDQESVAEASLDYRLQRWTATFDPGVAVDVVEVDARVRGEDGSVIDTWTYGTSTDSTGIAMRTSSIGGVNNNGMDPKLRA
ncbi:MAG: hypothetical protein R3F61_32945 [Myxococcota bacterium]